MALESLVQKIPNSKKFGLYYVQRLLKLMGSPTSIRFAIC